MYLRITPPQFVHTSIHDCVWGISFTSDLLGALTPCIQVFAR